MIRKIIKWIVFRIYYPCIYKLSSIRQVDNNKVIFVENHEDHLTDNFALVYNELRNRNYDIHIHYLRIASSDWGKIIKRSVSLIKDMATARFVFLDESNSLFGSFKLRKETGLIQLWHACGAFKKWGFSVAEKSFGDDEHVLKKYSGHRNYTLMTVSGDEVCWAYNEAFGLTDKKGIVQPLGVSRTDVFYDTGRSKEAYDKLKRIDVRSDGKKIIVYLPTFRGSIAEAKGPDAFDISEMVSLRDEYVILIKNHPFVKEPFPIPVDAKDYCIEISDELTVEDMLIVADICITDYSSVVFEYSLLNKPIIFYAYDIKEYDMERGFYYKYEDFVPGQIVYNMQELIKALNDIDQFDYARLEAFKNRFMNGCDGHATEKLLTAIGVK